MHRCPLDVLEFLDMRSGHLLQLSMHTNNTKRCTCTYLLYLLTIHAYVILYCMHNPEMVLNTIYTVC